MELRVNLGKVAPELYQAVAALDKLVAERAAKAGIAEGFGHLLRLRASQINGCAFCLRLHTRDALKCGESSDRISLVPAWRDTQYFNEKECAALALVEGITQVYDGHVDDPVYAAAAAVLTADEIAAVEWIAVVINAWNRISIASRYPVKA